MKINYLKNKHYKNSFIYNYLQIIFIFNITNVINNHNYQQKTIISLKKTNSINNNICTFLIRKFDTSKRYFSYSFYPFF